MLYTMGRRKRVFFFNLYPKFNSCNVSLLKSDSPSVEQGINGCFVLENEGAELLSHLLLHVAASIVALL